jgi:hypothetical protein
LETLLDRAGSTSEVATSPFGEALLMLIRLLGAVHRDHLQLVRSELERIDRLGQEINALRSPLDGRGAVPQPRATTEVRGSANGGVSPALVGDALPEVPPRLGPQAAREAVAERLSDWEKERQSRWRRVLSRLLRV